MFTRPTRSIHVMFVLLLALFASIACQPEDLGFGLDDLPPGDAARGAQIYTESINGAPACSACHAIDEGAKSGPSLGGYGAAAADRVSGQDAATYTFYSIVRPAKHVVRGYSNVMVSDYAEKLSRQDIADLIAYLVNLKTEN